MSISNKELFSLFVERASELKKEQFNKYIDKRRRISISFDGYTGKIKRSAPSSTSIKSFATVYRLFISDENISIKNLAKLLNDNTISAEWKSEYTQARDDINRFLDEPSDFLIGPDATAITRRYIVDIFLNGWIFHVKDTRKTNIYQDWKSDEFFYLNIEQEFIRITRYISDIIGYIAQICEKERMGL